jgi:hypothetical protein
VYDLHRPFLYNLLGSDMDRFMPSGCNFLQYVDDNVVYSSHHVLLTDCALVQTNCSSLIFFFSLFEPTISSTKSEVVLFSWRHLQPEFQVIESYFYMPNLDEELRLDIFKKDVFKD